MCMWVVLMHLRGGACGGPAREGQQHPILRGRGGPPPRSSSHHPTPFLHPPRCPEPLHPTQSAPLLTPPGTPGQGLTLPPPPQQAGLPGTTGPSVETTLLQTSCGSPGGWALCGEGEGLVFRAIIQQIPGDAL